MHDTAAAAKKSASMVANPPMHMPGVKAKHKAAVNTPEHRAKKSASIKAANTRPEVIAKKSGPNSHWWTGGKRKSGYNPEFADGGESMHAIFKRDGYRCQHPYCGVTVTGTKGPTQWNRHHIDGDINNDAFDNLVTLCMRCHKLIHISVHPARWQRYFTELVQRYAQ
jgi:hypothetical protein